MKIVDPGTQQIPNGLILAHIQSLDTKYTTQNRLTTIPPNLRAALRDVRTNLIRPPTSEANDPSAIHGTIPQSAIAKLSKALTKKEFGLLPSEILLIMNHRPMTREELAGLVEEMEERLDEGQQDRILEMVGKVFGNVKGANGVKEDILEGIEGEP